MKYQFTVLMKRILHKYDESKYNYDFNHIVIVNLRWKALPVPSIKDEQYAAAPYQRYGHSAVAYGTRVYIWGGRNDEAACNKLFCFDTGMTFL